MATKNSTAVTLRFNTKSYTFQNKAKLTAIIKREVKRAAPRDAQGLKHRAYLPGVKAPVSLQWAVLHLFGVEAQIPSAASKGKAIRGAYHPSQAMAALSKLNGFGVKVESDAPNPRYAPWLTRKAKAELDKTTRKTAARKTTRKTTAAK